MLEAAAAAVFLSKYGKSPVLVGLPGLLDGWMDACTTTTTTTTTTRQTGCYLGSAVKPTIAS